MSQKVRHLRVMREVARSLANRKCGTCTECCTHLAVKEIGKGLGVPCVHQVGKGCSIYERRPAECAEYNCLWRQGFVPIEHRPDRAGILCDSAGTSAVPVIIAREIRAGAFQEHMGLLEDWARKLVVVLCIEGEDRRAIGPPELVQQWYAEAKPRLQAEWEAKHGV